MVNIRHRTSSGGVLYRENENGLEVVLISHRGFNGFEKWCLPKGTVEEGESLEETALREVREETGIFGQVVEKLGEIQYEFYSKQDREKIFKSVHFYLLVYVSGSELDHDDEADEARWFPIDAAEEKLTHINEAAMVKSAKVALANSQVNRAAVSVS
ncbi:MAG: NUDIX hydrolase [Nitrospirota bacterium]